MQRLERVFKGITITFVIKGYERLFRFGITTQRIRSRPALIVISTLRTRDLELFVEGMLDGHAKGEAFNQNKTSERAKPSCAVLRRSIPDPSATQGRWVWRKQCLNCRSEISTLLLPFVIKMQRAGSHCTWHIEIL